MRRFGSWGGRSREKPGQTLQATALVHEAYLRLIGRGQGEPTWDSRAPPHS
ncbi:MAG: ECF-type sigma factor [Planctomycetota bacterium]